MNVSGNKKNLIVISGPTAVGKTALSIKLAKEINGSVISADSMQVYRGMDIGSAKITKEEMDGVKHYLIDILDPKDDFNIALFKQYAKEAVEEISAEGKIPIVAGGTGFYVQALLYDIDFDESASEDTSIRDELTLLAETKGNEYVHNMLKEIDPEAAEEIHFNNIKRVIRAIEFYRLTGEKISEHNKHQRQNQSPYNFKYFIINSDRSLLYERINKRVDIMIDNGLVDEVIKLKEAGLSTDNISMQGLGYKEILAYLNGETSLDEAIEIIKRDTRRFAKRQLTWFRREKDVIWINKEDYNFNDTLIIDYMKEQLRNEGII